MTQLIVTEAAVVEYCRQHPTTIAREIAHTLGITRTRVLYIREKHPELPRPHRGQQRIDWYRTGPSRRDRRVAVLIFQGASLVQVAKQMGVSWQRVQQILGQHWPFLRRPNVHSRRRKRIRAELMKTPRQSNRSIARTLGCAPMTVGRVRRELDLPRHPPSNRGRYARKPTNARARMAVRMLRAGRSRRDIARALGIAPGAIDVLRRRWIVGRVCPSQTATGEVDRPVWPNQMKEGGQTDE